ncbi:MAG: hypothetical protein IRZ31_11620 [Thermogemmatispora sp.]|uniref:hypothetical protein n=1 Tax=Thermogemmatispora sp. TaxID=1968838 RepID=UPI0026152F3E|nr:hypothetical protein [Thermogemmatispora sp.]MBX5457541.1 hypothetical protein [Thermogemmatispora sp.]
MERNCSNQEKESPDAGSVARGHIQAAARSDLVRHTALSRLVRSGRQQCRAGAESDGLLAWPASDLQPAARERRPGWQQEGGRFSPWQVFQRQVSRR